jgi:hypothetical protein
MCADRMLYADRGNVRAQSRERFGDQWQVCVIFLGLWAIGECGSSLRRLGGMDMARAQRASGSLLFQRRGINPSQLQSHRAAQFVLHRRAHVAAEGQARVVRADNRESLVKVVNRLPLASILRCAPDAASGFRYSRGETPCTTNRIMVFLVCSLPSHHTPDVK